MKYFRNTSWMFAEQVLRIFAGLFVGIWVARYLGPEQFGVFSYALAFTTIFAGVAKLGLDGIMVRELVNHPEKRDIYLGTAFWLKCLGSLLTLALVALATLFTSNDTTTNQFIFIIAAGLIFQSFEVIDFYFQSQVLAKFVSLCKIAQLGFSSLIKIYLVFTKGELISFVFVSLLDQVTLAISLFIAYRYHRSTLFYKNFDFKTANNLLKDSWPLIFSTIFIMLYMRLDQVMIKEMLGEYDVGIYSAATRLSEALYFIPTLITSSLFPAIVNAKQNSKALYHGRLQRLYILVVWIAIGIAVPMTFLANWVVIFLFGHIYEQAGGLLVVHIWTGIFVSLGVASSKWFLIENLQTLALYRTMFGVVANVAANLILIPRLGVMGAAIGTLIAQLCAAYLFDFLNIRTRELFWLKTSSILPFVTGTLKKESGIGDAN